MVEAAVETEAAARDVRDKQKAMLDKWMHKLSIIDSQQELHRKHAEKQESQEVNGVFIIHLNLSWPDKQP